MKKIPPKNKSVLIWVCSYIILFFLTSSYHLDFLVLVMQVPLLVISYGKKLTKILVPVFFSVILAVSLSFLWVLKYNFMAYAMCTLIFSSFLFIFALLFNILTKKIKNHLEIYVAPSIHLVLMLVYSFSVINSYWIDLSMFQSMSAPLIWIIGSQGITFLIMLFSSSAAFYILKKERKYLATMIILFLIFFGCYAYSSLAKPEGRKVRIALLQGNFNESWRWRNINARGAVFDGYEAMSIEAAKNNPDIIVWPEYAIAEDILKDKNLMGRISALAKKTKSYLVFGTVSWTDGFFKDERNRMDIAAVFSPEGSLVGRYASVKPVPFERWVIPGNISGFSRTAIGNFGLTLCYEETQDKISRDYSSQGAEFLVSLANNQRLGGTAGFYLASLYSNLRAAENGKYLVRASNTGITKIINPYGKVEAVLEPNKKGMLVWDIYANNKTTFYSRFGNTILYGCLILISMLITLKILAKKCKTKKLS